MILVISTPDFQARMWRKDDVECETLTGKTFLAAGLGARREAGWARLSGQVDLRSSRE